jgi:hypothetical protein
MTKYYVDDAKNYNSTHTKNPDLLDMAERDTSVPEEPEAPCALNQSDE